MVQRLPGPPAGKPGGRLQCREQLLHPHRRCEPLVAGLSTAALISMLGVLVGGIAGIENCMHPAVWFAPLQAPTARASVRSTTPDWIVAIVTTRRKTCGIA